MGKLASCPEGKARASSSMHGTRGRARDHAARAECPAALTLPRRSRGDSLAGRWQARRTRRTGQRSPCSDTGRGFGLSGQSPGPASLLAEAPIKIG